MHFVLERSPIIPQQALFEPETKPIRQTIHQTFYISRKCLPYHPKDEDAYDEGRE